MSRFVNLTLKQTVAIRSIIEIEKLDLGRVKVTWRTGPRSTSTTTIEGPHALDVWRKLRYQGEPTMSGDPDLLEDILSEKPKWTESLQDVEIAGQMMTLTEKSYRDAMFSIEGIVDRKIFVGYGWTRAEAVTSFTNKVVFDRMVFDARKSNEIPSL